MHWLRARRTPLLACALTLLALLWRFDFFQGGRVLPAASDINLANYRQYRFALPPRGAVSNDYWLGLPVPANALNPLTLGAHAAPWLFFTAFYPLCAALAVGAFYFFLRQLQCPRWAALAGGLFYGWQGELASGIFAGHFSAAALIAIFPVALWAAWRAAESLPEAAASAAWKWAALWGAALGMMVTLLADRALLCAGLSGAVFLWKSAPPGQAARRAAHWKKAPAALAWAAAFALLVGAPGVAAAWEQAISGAHAAAGRAPAARYGWATQWSWPPEEFFSWLVPGFFGWHSASETGPYWGRLGAGDGLAAGLHNFSLGTSAFGTLACALALLGTGVVWRRRNAGAEVDGLEPAQQAAGRFFSLGALVCGVLALGKFTPLYRLVWALPLMGDWRNPVKFLLPALACVLVLATFGLQALRHWIGSPDAACVGKLRGARRAAVSAGTGLVLLWLLGGAMPSTFAAKLEQLDYAPKSARAIVHTGRTSLLLAGALLLMGGWLLRLASLQRRTAIFRLEVPNPWLARWRDRWLAHERIGLLIAALLVLFNCTQQFWVIGHYILPTDPQALWRRPSWIAALQAAQIAEGPCRVHVEVGDPTLRQALTLQLPAHGIASMDIPAASRIPEDYAAFFAALEKNPQRLMDLAGARFWLLPADQAEQVEGTGAAASVVKRYGLFLTAQALASGQPSHILMERAGWLPKLTFVPSVKTPPPSVPESMGDHRWDPRLSLLTSEEDAQRLAPGKGASGAREPGRILSLDYAPGFLRARLSLDHPTYVLINDHFDPRWRAQINGKPAPLVRADICLMAAALPAEATEFTLTYDDPGYSVWVQLAALAGLAAWWAGSRLLGKNDAAHLEA